MGRRFSKPWPTYGTFPAGQTAIRWAAPQKRPFVGQALPKAKSLLILQDPAYPVQLCDTSLPHQRGDLCARPEA